MSPRRARRRPEGGTPPERPFPEDTVEQAADGDWVVRPVGPAAKAYRCPGCQQEIRPGTPHVVAWPADRGGPDDRRHWHTACWRRRDRRGPDVERSRNAPRYG